MARALGTIKFTPAAMAELIAEGPVARARYFADYMESVGGRLIDYYFVDSPDMDALTICELPDEWASDPVRFLATWAKNRSNGYAERIAVNWIATPEEFAAGLDAAERAVGPGSE